MALLSLREEFRREERRKLVYRGIRQRGDRESIVRKLKAPTAWPCRFWKLPTPQVLTITRNW
jgi:hypothetical protein